MRTRFLIIVAALASVFGVQQAVAKSSTTTAAASKKHHKMHMKKTTGSASRLRQKQKMLNSVGEN